MEPIEISVIVLSIILLSFFLVLPFNSNLDNIFGDKYVLPKKNKINNNKAPSPVKTARKRLSAKT
jgi:hypothetical protein